MTDAPTRARARNPLAFLDAEIEDLKAKGLIGACGSSRASRRADA